MRDIVRFKVTFRSATGECDDEAERKIDEFQRALQYDAKQFAERMGWQYEVEDE